MKKKISKEVKTGLFGVCMIILLYLGVNFIKSQDIFSGNDSYCAIYDHADGIAASSPVEIRGYRIGTVDEVRFDMPTRKVVVEMSVKKQYKLPKDSEAKIKTTGLLGSKVIDIKLGTQTNYLESGDTIRALSEPGLLEMATGEYDKLKQQATTLVAQLSQALDGVNAVLSRQNVANLSGSLAHLNSITGQVDRMVKTDVVQTIRNLNELSNTLKKAGPKIDHAIDHISSASDSLPALMANAAEAMDELNMTLAAVNNADGTVGKLIHDQTLYRNLSAASASLTLLLQDFKQNPGRYVHFSVFGGGTKNKDRSSGIKSKN